METIKLLKELPAGIKQSDLQMKSWKDMAYDSDGNGNNTNHFELWLVKDIKEGLTWFIPTLLISKNNRNSYGSRTYAVDLSGRLCRIGKGPHVVQTLTVYLKKNNIIRLQKYLDLKKNGSEKSNQVRDRISSRRAEGQLHRAAGQHSWRWGSL